jgi:hypothetical protein
MHSENNALEQNNKGELYSKAFYKKLKSRIYDDTVDDQPTVHKSKKKSNSTKFMIPREGTT